MNILHSPSNTNIVNLMTLICLDTVYSNETLFKLLNKTEKDSQPFSFQLTLPIAKIMTSKFIYEQ